MSYTSACLLVIFTIVAAAVASHLVCRTLGVEARRRQHEVGNAVFLQIGVMFAVLLAFVFNEVWSEYNIAAQAINRECGALHGAAMLANALPAEQGRVIERGILTYARTVVDTEWQEMAQRQRSEQAVDDLRAVMEAAAHLGVTRPVDVSTQGQILALLAQAHAQRETRIFQMTQGLPAVMWFVLITLALLLIGCVLLAGVDSAVCHLAFASSFAGCTVMVLLLVRMLDYPFEGALTLSDGDFREMIRVVSGMMIGR